jgi:hypothetical protein
MITYGGERVYANDDGVPSLHTIGVSLGRIARFNGHTAEWYPVLPHVLVVASLLPDNAALYGLIHDAPEVCCADVPSPWKTKAAKAREARLLKRMYRAWGLKWPLGERIEAQVAEADMKALTAEFHVLGGATPVQGIAQPRWEAPLFAEPDPHAVELTSMYLDLAPNFLRAEVAGPMFEEAFSHYKGILDERNNAKREARNAARRERRAQERANETGTGVDRQAS